VLSRNAAAYASTRNLSRIPYSLGASAPTHLKKNTHSVKLKEIVTNRKLHIPSEENADAKQKKSRENSSIIDSAKRGIQKVPGLVWDGTQWILSSIWAVSKDPKLLVVQMRKLKEGTIEMVHHYWLGTKLLLSDIKTARTIVSRLVTSGRGLTRRERKQLVRTTSDIFRMVPLIFFVVVPFMEFALPFFLKLFPNMLPSTFQDKHKREENMKKELEARLGLNHFLQETLEAMVRKKNQATNADGISSKDLEEFAQKARSGRGLENDEIIRFAKFFKDEMMLDNLSRPQLVALCRYMGLQPYGNDNFLAFQLRVKVRTIIQDDQRILWEGIHSLTYAELQEACRERGMRHLGLTSLGYRRQLQQWIDLSINKAVPISLLIMSRAFNLSSKDIDPAAALADSIGALDDEILDEVLLEVASTEESGSLSMRLRKLESIKRQNELIEEEYKKRLNQKKKLEAELKKKEEEKKRELQRMEQEINEMQESVHEIAIASEKIASADAMQSDSSPPVAEPVWTEARTLTEKPQTDRLVKEHEAGEESVCAPEPALSLEQLQTLSHLVEKDMVVQAKAAVVEMKAKLASYSPTEEEVSALSQPDIALSSKQQEGTQDGLAPPVPKVSSKKDLDVHSSRMTSKLSQMLSKLEMEISKVEAPLTEQFDLLDKDNDGRISVSELEDVLKNALKLKSDPEFLTALINEIDKDHDGVMTIPEVREWLRKKLAAAEVQQEVELDSVAVVETLENLEAEKKPTNITEGTGK